MNVVKSQPAPGYSDLSIMGLLKSADVPQVGIFPALWDCRQTSDVTPKLTVESADEF